MDIPLCNAKNLIKCLVVVGLLCLLYGCDLLEDDVSPTAGEVEIQGTEVYTIANGSTIIDLQAMVKSQGSVRLQITSHPEKGSLTELGNGFLQYLPDEGFSQGRDAFFFSVFSQDSRLLLRDTVIIIVDDDTTNLPCGFYPKNDYVTDTIAAPLTIDVLNNDFICGDTMNIKVEIYRPNAGFPPQHGVAEVLPDHRIRYTPGSTFTGTDKIIYKVYSLSDTTVSGYGTVYIASSACSLKLRNDSFTAKGDSAVMDTLRFDVFRNDSLCHPTTRYNLSIVQGPHHGTASLTYDMLKYVPDDAYKGLDSLTYKVCEGQQCAEAKVKIAIH